MKPNDIKHLIRAAHAGGRVLRKYFGRTLNPVEKSTLWDFQTEADIGSEKAILRILRKAFPTYNIHAEEEGKTDNGSDYTIVIDPLDGTNNFVLGIPNFSISIAVLHQNKALAGVIYHPILKQTYHAFKDKGAYLDGKRIKVSGTADPRKATIAYNCGYKNSRTRVRDIIARLIENDHKRIILNWSPAYDYCLIASGKIEAMVSDIGTEIYDFGAGKLIALEAGGKIFTYAGKEDTDFLNDQFVLSNSEKIAQHVLKTVNSVKQSRQ